MVTSGAPAARLQTPVDLHAYTVHLTKPMEPPPAPMDQPMMEMAAPAEAAAPPLTRRPPLDLTLPLRSSSEEGKGDMVFDGDLSSPLDVPAFLRRQH